MVIIIIVQIGKMLIGCIKKLNKSKIGCLILAKEVIPLWSENAKYIYITNNEHMLKIHK